MPELMPELWYLAFQKLDSKWDLANVCMVSRAFHALATPVLYRSISLGGGGTSHRAHWDVLPDDVYDPVEGDAARPSIVAKLLDESSTKLRVYVRDVTYEGCLHPEDGERIVVKLEQPDNVLIKLLKTLPSLENVFLRDELPLTPSFIEALSSHRSKPALHLLNECGSTHLDFKMPCVRTLHTSVNAVSAFLRPQRKLNLRDVFIKCPSLKDLSVNVSNLQREPMRSTPRYRTVQIVEHLVLDPNETMPPIESLRLSGYNAGGQEWDYWRTKFPWDKLKSLTLGPEETLNFIRLAIGYARNLRCLAVSAYSRPHLERCPDLEELLVSFDTLRHLEVKGYFPSIAAVVNHRDLTSLTLHTIERPTRQRSILKLEDVRYLDEYCPKLETLEIDLRHVGGWPGDIVAALAKGFRNLRRLSIHVGSEIRKMEERSQDALLETHGAVPTLTDSTARDFARLFFHHKRPTSNIQTVTLKSGEELRRHEGSNTPLYVKWEEANAKTFVVRFPQNEDAEPVLTELTGGELQV